MKLDRSRRRAAVWTAAALEPRRLFAAALPADVVGLSQPGGSFQAIVADPARDRVYLSSGGDELLVVDTATGDTVKSITLAGEPHGLAITPDGASLLIAEPYSHQVQVFSTATLTSLRVMNVGEPVLAIAAGVGGKFYGITSTDAAINDYYNEQNAAGSEAAAQFDLATGARGASIDAPGSEALTIRADSAGKRIYVGSTGPFRSGDGFSVTDVSDPAAPVALPALAAADGYYLDVFDDRTAGRTYVTHASDRGQLLEIRHAGGATVEHELLGDDGSTIYGTLAGVAGTPGGSYVFVTISDTGGVTRVSTLLALDAATGALRQTYTLPSANQTDTVVVTPNGRAAFIADDATGPFFDSDETWGLGIVGTPTVSIAGAPNVVFGTAFADANGDGVRQSSEAGNWTDEFLDDHAAVVVYADLNGNGKLDANSAYSVAAGDEPHTLVYGAGDYRLTLPTDSGTYAIRFLANPGEIDHLPLIATGAASRTITLGDGEQVAGVDFGVARGLSVFGRVFADLDGDGAIDANEPDVAGAQVYLDLNNDGTRQSTEPLAIVAAGENGTFTFDNVYAGLTAIATSAVVRLLNAKGYALTTPASKSVSVPSDAGDVEVDFGIRPQVTLTGTLFRDANANGVRDAGEPALSGARVWLDLNGNGRYAKGEPTTLADADGHYVIDAKTRREGATNVLVRGADLVTLRMAQEVRSVTFGDWRQTVTQNFGAYPPATLSISAFIDRDRNRKHNRGDAWLANTIAFIDADNDGKQDKNERYVLTDAEGNATFGDLGPGTYVIRLRVSSKLNANRGTAATVTLAVGEGRAIAMAARTV